MGNPLKFLFSKITLGFLFLLIITGVVSAFLMPSKAYAMFVNGHIIDSQASPGGFPPGHPVAGIKVQLICGTCNNLTTTTDAAGNFFFTIDPQGYAVRTVPNAQDNYQIPGYLEPPVPTNRSALCNSADGSYENQLSTGVCGANSHPDCGTNCDFTLNPIPALAMTNLKAVCSANGTQVTFSWDPYTSVSGSFPTQYVWAFSIRVDDSNPPNVWDPTNTAYSNDFVTSIYNPATSITTNNSSAQPIRIGDSYNWSIQPAFVGETYPFSAPSFQGPAFTCAPATPTPTPTSIPTSVPTPTPTPTTITYSPADFNRDGNIDCTDFSDWNQAAQSAAACIGSGLSFICTYGSQKFYPITITSETKTSLLDYLVWYTAFIQQPNPTNCGQGG